MWNPVESEGNPLEVTWVSLYTRTTEGHEEVNILSNINAYPQVINILTEFLSRKPLSPTDKVSH